MKIKIKEKIAEEGKKIGYVAELLDVDRATLRNWINERTPIPFWAAIRISEILRCSLYDLYERGEEE